MYLPRNAVKKPNNISHGDYSHRSYQTYQLFDNR